MKNKTIIDLCAGSGEWSRPYKEAGYNVVTITLPNFDVTRKPVQDMCVELKPYGILAAPPCTMFSFCRTKAKTPRDLKKGMECVRACEDIIWRCMEKIQETRRKTVDLKFHALENPNGMLKFFLGKPAFTFNPYDFGDNYKKNTYLWGWFNDPIKPLFDVLM